MKKLKSYCWHLKLENAVAHAAITFKKQKWVWGYGQGSFIPNNFAIEDEYLRQKKFGCHSGRLMIIGKYYGHEIKRSFSK